MTIILALIGCGGIARRHVQAMKELHERGRGDFAVAAVCARAAPNHAVASTTARPSCATWRDRFAPGFMLHLLAATHLSPFRFS